MPKRSTGARRASPGRFGRDRLDVEQRKAASQDESLQAHVQKYVKQKEGQADAGEVSVGRVYALKLHLGHFEDWLGKDTAVRDIDGEVLADYHAHLLSRITSKEWSRTTANHYLTTVKSFVRWLWQIEAIESLPRLLDGRSQFLKISKPAGKVVIFSKDEVKTLLAGGVRADEALHPADVELRHDPEGRFGFSWSPRSIGTRAASSGSGRRPPTRRTCRP